MGTMWSGEKCDICNKKAGTGAFKHGMHIWKGKTLCDECFLIDRLKEILADVRHQDKA